MISTACAKVGKDPTFAPRHAHRPPADPPRATTRGTSSRPPPRPPPPWRLLLLLGTTFLFPTTTKAAGEGKRAYTCDAALGDVPLTKALYASIQAGELADGFDAVTCIPTEAFMDHTTPLSFAAKMPNLISIGDRAFKGFKGGTFAFQALDAAHMPKLEHIGEAAFAEFDPKEVTEAAITLQGMPSLISIGDGAFATLRASFMVIEVECACSNLEVIGGLAFQTVEYGTGSKITFTDLSRLRTIAPSAFQHFGDAANNHDLIFTGVSPFLTSIGAGAFR